MLLLGYILAELYLPDPYTGGIGMLASRPGAVGNGGATVSAGFLVSDVTWTSPAKPALRLFDTAHAHPVAPPSTEASSPAVAPVSDLHLTPVPLHPTSELKTQPAATERLSGGGELTPQAAVITPDPLPPTAPGVVLLVLSTRTSQLGVEVTTQERLNLLYTIDGLSVRGPAELLPLTTLPAMAWEPMYDLSTAVDPQVDDFELLQPPNDGPLTKVRAVSARLIPISPLQSLQSALDAGRGAFTARLTLPFGMVAALDNVGQNGTILPNIGLVQPTFNATLTPTGVPVPIVLPCGGSNSDSNIRAASLPSTISP